MSSSSDEDLSKFKEATDVKLFNDSLFSDGKAELSFTAPVKPSQRHLDAPDENRTDLKVTPGFQKHVASHLMKILDSSLDQDTSTVSAGTPEHDPNGNYTSKIPLKQPEGGIKLFGASAAFLASCNITPPPPTKRRKRGRKFACLSSESEDDSSSNEVDIPKDESLGLRDEIDLSERFAACAVSSDWILNGDAVKGWAPPFRNKEPLQGEATPDLLKVTVLYKREKSRKRRKKEKSLEDSVQNKKRGKRGGSKRSKKKKVKENDNLEISQNPPENQVIGQSPSNIAESLTSASKKKKKKKRKGSDLECMQEDIEKHTARKYRKLEILCRKFASVYLEERGLEGTSGAVVGEKKKKKKKKKRSEEKHKQLLLSVDGEVEDKLNFSLLKELQKKEKKKRRRGVNLNLPVAAAEPTEDEGFNSDPTKDNKMNKEQTRWLNEQKKSDKNSSQNNMEFLSMDLANPLMTNVKQD